MGAIAILTALLKVIATEVPNAVSIINSAKGLLGSKDAKALEDGYARVSAGADQAFEQTDAALS